MHDVEMRSISRSPAGYERFLYWCQDCDWQLVVTEDDTPEGTPPDAFARAVEHRRTVGARG